MPVWLCFSDCFPFKISDHCSCRYFWPCPRIWHLGASWMFKDGKIIVTNCSCSPTRRKHESFSTLSEKKSFWKESWRETWKSTSHFLGRWTLRLPRRFPHSPAPSLPRAGREEVPTKRSCGGKSCSQRGDVISRLVRSNFTGGSESGWSPRAELCVGEGSDVGGSLCGSAEELPYFYVSWCLRRGVCDFIRRYDVSRLLRTKVRSRRHRDSLHIWWGMGTGALSAASARCKRGWRRNCQLTSRPESTCPRRCCGAGQLPTVVPVRTLCPCPSNWASPLQGCSELEGCGGRWGTDSLNLRIQRKRWEISLLTEPSGEPIWGGERGFYCPCGPALVSSCCPQQVAVLGRLAETRGLRACPRLLLHGPELPASASHKKATSCPCSHAIRTSESFPSTDRALLPVAGLPPGGFVPAGPSARAHCPPAPLPRSPGVPCRDCGCLGRFQPAWLLLAWLSKRKKKINPIYPDLPSAPLACWCHRVAPCSTCISDALGFVAEIVSAARSAAAWY